MRQTHGPGIALPRARTCSCTFSHSPSLVFFPADTWWPFKWRDPQTGGWFDCHQWELRSDGTRRWYHSSGNTCSDYHGVNYAWNTRYWYWDLQDQRYYECLSYNYYKGGTPYPCGLPPPAGYNAPMGGYTGPQYTGGGY